MNLKKISETEYQIPQEGKMQVPVKIFADEKLMKSIKQDETLKQAMNVASLPGLIDNVILCPDAHQGYGMPIGGIAAFSLDSAVIAPGMIGFDINCGVRLLSTDITAQEFARNRKKIIHNIKKTIPSGIGQGGEKYSQEIIKQVLVKGAEWAVENSLGVKEDLIRCEENGKIKGANPEDVSQRAIARGTPQLGTLGAGNHFIDILIIDDIFQPEIAKIFNLKKGNIAILIHCGSRGLGHQIASDYLKKIDEEYGSANLPDRELVNAPINSKLGQSYLSAMRCAVNFAFCNRQIIMHKIREIFEREYLNKKVNLVYDIAHNIAKIESKKLIVRKGATRAFGPGNKEIPLIYRKSGQPVLIPGSMSTRSFVLVGTKEAEKISFASSAHGAGRAHSRSWAHKELTSEDVKKILAKKDIILEGSFKGTLEESELAYKDIEEVIDVTEKSGLSKKVASLKPIAVVIG